MKKCRHGKDYTAICCECLYGSKFDKNGNFIEENNEPKDLVEVFKKGERDER